MRYVLISRFTSYSVVFEANSDAYAVKYAKESIGERWHDVMRLFKISIEIM